MAFSKIILNGTTLIDLTQDTVSANSEVLSPKTFHKADGTTGTGSITAKSASDVTVSGATVTIPAGAYSSQVQKSVETGSATVPSLIAASGATVSTETNAITLSKTVTTSPNVTSGYISTGTVGNCDLALTASVTTQAAQTIHPSTSDQTIASGTYLTGAQTIKAVTLANLTADNIKNGVTVKVGDSTDDDCVTSVTGTYAGGGTSKNVQISQTAGRASSSTYTQVGPTITVAKTGTYDVYWTGYRSSTSGTNGTQLYIGNSSYGSAQTTFDSSYTNLQHVHLSNVSLTANQVVSIRARSRGNNYYMYVQDLVIIEA